jgi:hypothetical protein
VLLTPAPYQRKRWKERRPAAREALPGRVIERGTIMRCSALLGDSPLTQRFRFLLEMPIANLF